MSLSLSSFRTQLIAVDQLIAIHGKLQTGRGRRHEQDALHKAAVVMIVAAWQAYIEKVLKEGLEEILQDLIAPGGALAPAPAWAVNAFKMRVAVINTSIKKFNTPDDVKVRDLFTDSVGYSPWLHWAWNQGRRQWTIEEVRKRTNAWVLIRHSIAHGFELPADIAWIKDAKGHPRLNMTLVKECKKHFIHLATQTDISFSDHLQADFGLARPW